MKKLIWIPIAAAFVIQLSCAGKHLASMVNNDTILVSDTIQNHPVRVSKTDGSILPWFSADMGESYDTVLMLVWDFWKNMEADSNGLKYYMNHQVWKPEHDMRGLGGDNEQTVYRVPGNSHSSRQASVELMYGALSGDTTFKDNAIRTLNWATYTVAADGRNRYIRDDIWLTDGYGDYVRHYLRAMAAMPELAPDDESHLLGTNSVITSIVYSGNSIEYNTFDKESTELIRLVQKPAKVMMNDSELTETESSEPDGWNWSELQKGGVLKIFKKEGNNVLINF